VRRGLRVSEWWWPVRVHEEARPAVGSVSFRGCSARVCGVPRAAVNGGKILSLQSSPVTFCMVWNFRRWTADVHRGREGKAVQRGQPTMEVTSEHS
jgi:hypothetical protein